MADVNNFDVLKEMGKRNGKIFLAPLGTNFLRAQKVKAGGQVTMAVSEEALMGLFTKRYVGGLILADRGEFERVKAELAARSTAEGTSPTTSPTAQPQPQIVQQKKKD